MKMAPLQTLGQYGKKRKGLSLYIANLISSLLLSEMDVKVFGNFFLLMGSQSVYFLCMLLGEAVRAQLWEDGQTYVCAQ